MGVRSLGNVLASYGYKFGTTGLEAVNPAPIPSGLTATGGIINDYGNYRAHIFTGSNTFAVTDLGNISSTVEYLVVAGGGGGGTFGGGNAGGGGGAGGLRTSVPGVQDSAGNPLTGTAFPVSVANYVVTIGGGGVGAIDGNGDEVTNGVNSYFGPPNAPEGITATGGGHGGSTHPAGGAAVAQTGGSGGGGGGVTSYAGGSGNTPPTTPSQGFAGGPGYNANPYVGGGGGGAGEAGNTDGYAHGGDGVQVAIAGPPTASPVGTPGPSGNGWFAGGGGGGSYPSPPAPGPGGVGGGGAGSDDATNNGTPGTYATGGGGGGGSQPSSGPGGGSGGSGIVVIRYQIAESESGSAKATGGAISFYGGKTIHAFTNSGTFATTSDWSAATVEYVVVGGGGAGVGGGGGAGAYRTGTTPIGAHPVSTTIQIGGGGVAVTSPSPIQGDATNGTPSYFGTPITSPGGGKGGQTNPHSVGVDGGSGGGGGSYPSSGSAGGSATGSPFPGTIGVTPSSGWGHDGGTGTYPTPNPQIPGSSSGGGGGAGSAGIPAGTYPGSPGQGGGGMQLPTTFRDPKSTVGHPGPQSPPFTGGDNSGNYWLAGGGGGGWTAGGGGGGTQASPYAGAGAGGGNPNSPPDNAGFALANSGSGGGGSHQDVAGNGGSGIVLIAYPT